MRRAQADPEANATLIRSLSLLSLAFLLPFAIAIVLIQVAASTAQPTPCHAISCGPGPLALPLFAAFCVLGPTVGGLLAGALAWLESMRQSLYSRQRFWLIGLLLAGVLPLSPILALLVSGGESPILLYGISPELDIALVPLAAIPTTLITLLFGIVGASTPTRPTAKKHEAAADILT